MGPAGVRRDVATDLRLLGGARVGREEESVLASEPVDGGGADPGLDVDAPQQGVERSHRRHPLQAEDDSTADRDGAAREPGAAAAGHDRHVVRVAPGHHARDLVARPRQRDGIGMSVDPAAIRVVGQVARRLAAEDRISEQRAELPHERSVSR